jgi:hypothetical protein
MLVYPNDIVSTRCILGYESKFERMLLIVLEEASSIEQGIGLEMNIGVPYNDEMFSANDTVGKRDVLLRWSRCKICVDSLPH